MNIQFNNLVRRLLPSLFLSMRRWKKRKVSCEKTI